mmetsp:Transcript_3123/g.4320  ORF Transcript_3123/g.4320 Transcript_3123/m.4320 type:complete len:425 (-) Transcript_3123:109-1383(-)|eukprot:CAMPEP_0170064030 /NCGR_PEP_ID=MMETSP0019_2-20121128/4676_1 /TAXON_ID=98059 /ORGANISM="Dinobryon sp., Strain UTEXLB2267" /LENGTH=424 /DNA_ID=CAMNT_0010270609 /DNA_START=84 /DNA_END=1358 /DNA_ORIENTATION=-
MAFWISNQESTDKLANGIINILKIGVFAYGLYSTYRVLGFLSKFQAIGSDPASSANAKAILSKRLKRPDLMLMDFDSYELRIMAEGVIDVDEANVTFKDIGGLDEELEEVKDNVVLPMQIWKYFKHLDSSTSSCPTGVLLYGSPGTGKTLTAKAIAAEAGATFINVKASSVMDKFLGESDKLVSALFKVGRKLAPSVIFIDEIETLLKKRTDSPFNSQAHHTMQGVFLSEWDGLALDQSKAPVVVLGATNRPNDLDKAFLRRMPVRVNIKMPDNKGRLQIFKAHLARENVSGDVDLEELARQTENCTGSDIKELVRTASMRRKKEFMQQVKEEMEVEKQRLRELNAKLAVSGSATELKEEKAFECVKNGVTPQLRPLSQEDFAFALNKRSQSGKGVTEYNAELQNLETKNKMDELKTIFSSMKS